MVNLDKVSLADIIPSSLASSVQVQSAISGIDPELRLVGGAVGEVLLLARIDELPEGVIDLLAWQYHCDFYDDSLSLEQKRNLVRDSILWHRKKGTKWAVIKVLENLGIKAEVKEWFETGSAPYTFTVAVTFPGDPDKTYNFMDSEVEQTIRDAINEAKPVHADVFSIVAKDENRDPNHICFWDVCNYEHGAFGVLAEGDVCEAERPDLGEVLHFGQHKEYSDSVAILRYLAFDVARWDDKPPDTGSTLFYEVTHCIECEREGGEVSISFRSYPITMATWDEAVFDGLPVMEPTSLTGGWSGKFDDGARFDDMNHKLRERRMVTSFISTPPVIEFNLKDLGLMPTFEIAGIQQSYFIEADGSERETEFAVQQLWAVYDTWRTRKVWSMRSWRNNSSSPDVVENTFQSEVLDLALAQTILLEIEREPLPRFDKGAILDGPSQEQLPNCVTVVQSPLRVLDPEAITIEFERQPRATYDDAILDGDPPEHLSDDVMVTQVSRYALDPNAITIEFERQPQARFDKAKFDDTQPEFLPDGVTVIQKS